MIVQFLKFFWIFNEGRNSGMCKHPNFVYRAYRAKSPPPLAKFVGIKGGGDLVRDRRPKAKSGSKRGAGLSARQAA